MKYAIDMGSGDMMYIPSFMKIDSGTQNLTDRHTESLEIAYIVL
jgi:hypothetical protein